MVHQMLPFTSARHSDPNRITPGPSWFWNMYKTGPFRMWTLVVMGEKMARIFSERE